jgi:hypothetical protein
MDNQRNIFFYQLEIYNQLHKLLCLVGKDILQIIFFEKNLLLEVKEGVAFLSD